MPRSYESFPNSPQLRAITRIQREGAAIELPPTSLFLLVCMCVSLIHGPPVRLRPLAVLRPPLPPL